MRKTLTILIALVAISYAQSQTFNWYGLDAIKSDSGLGIIDMKESIDGGRLALLTSTGKLKIKSQEFYLDKTTEAYLVKLDTKGELVWGTTMNLNDKYIENESGDIYVFGNANLFDFTYVNGEQLDFLPDIYRSKIDGKTGEYKRIGGEENSGYDIYLYEGFVTNGVIYSCLESTYDPPTFLDNPKDDGIYITKHDTSGNFIEEFYYDITGDGMRLLDMGSYFLLAGSASRIEVDTVSFNRTFGSQFFMLALDKEDGSLKWSKTYPSEVFEIFELSKNDANEIYVGGIFVEKLDFTEEVLTPSESIVGQFMVKFDAKGDAIYQNHVIFPGDVFTSQLQSLPEDVTIDKRGYTYLSGMFGDELQIGDIIISNDFNPNAENLYVAIFDENGDYLETVQPELDTAIVYNSKLIGQENGAELWFGMVGDVILGNESNSSQIADDNYVGDVVYSLISDDKNLGFFDFGSTTKHLTLYPNPTNTYFNLPENLETTQLVLFDSNGNIVRQIDSKEGMKYDVSELRSGLYLLKAENSTWKLIVK